MKVQTGPSAWCPQVSVLRLNVNLGYAALEISCAAPKRLRLVPRPQFVCSGDPADTWERIETGIKAHYLRDVMLFHHRHVHGIPS